MTARISKKTALERISHDRMDPGGCLICEILERSDNDLILHQEECCTVFLTKYPRSWGHVIVATNEHLTKISDLTDSIYTRCFQLSRQVALIQEQKLNPVNIYISSIGSSDNHINTCPHFHIHVLPLYDKNIRPSEVFTWEKGISTGSEQEWKELIGTLTLPNNVYK